MASPTWGDVFVPYRALDILVLTMENEDLRHQIVLHRRFKILF
jgi:hypothetical protein